MKKLVLLASAVIATMSVFAQKDLIISGGNCVSSMVCDNSRVFVWGKNTNGLLGLGSSNTAAIYSTPQEVTFFNGNDISVQQVNSGSGSHFLALTCKGHVYAWGNNSLGQCGTGDVANSQGVVQREPTRVKIGTGSLAGTAYDDGGYLANVDVVYAGNNSSFAILGDGAHKGKLVGWGGNSQGFDSQGFDNCYGQLGCGNQENQKFPVFVINGKTNQPLENVVQVFAGDNSAYALTADGTVWSWGYEKSNGSLGRNENGNGNSGPAEKKSSKAYPVCFADGSPLTGITMLGCGDGAGYALDADGYIWSWGNGAWNNSAGYMDANSGWIGASSVPLRVRAGTTTGASNDGTYLLAKYVSGGQGFGMAISADNKPVAWGGDIPTNGGLTGNGKETKEGDTDTYTHYIEYAPGKVHENIVIINRGDLWGFYETSDGQFYAWGGNEFGQLGIGGTNHASRATKIDLPRTCQARDPEASIDLTPGDMIVCANDDNTLKEDIMLRSGFVLDMSTYGKKYEISWSKNGVTVPNSAGTLEEKGPDLSVSEPGTYEVTVKHAPVTDGSCFEYEPAIEEVTIDVYPKTFTPTGTYCGNTAIVKSGTTNAKAVYSWYKNVAGGTPLAESIGNAEIEFDISGVVANSSKIKTIYVEETSQASGSFLTSLTREREENMNNGTFTDKNALGFIVNEPITITGFDYGIQTELWSNGDAINATSTFKVVGAKYNNGGYIPDYSKQFGTMSSVYERVRDDGVQQKTDVGHAEGSITLQPGQYFLALTGFNNSTNKGQVKMYRGGQIAANTKDNVNGNIIQFQSVANNSPNQNIGAFAYNLQFKTAQGYCNRVPVELEPKCPCTSPADVSLTNTSVLSICNGTATTLESGPQPSGVGFEWTMGTTVKSDTKTLITNVPGVYTLRVYDNAKPTVQECWKTKDFELKAFDLPEVSEITSTQTEYCEGEDIQEIAITFTSGISMLEAVLTDANNEEYGSFGILEDMGGEEGDSEVFFQVKDYLSEVGEYTLKINSLMDVNWCENTVSDELTITIKPVPTVTVDNDGPACEGGKIVVTATPSDAAVTFAWSGKDSGTSSSITLNPVTLSQAGDYTVEPLLNGCKGATATTTVEVNQKPTITKLSADVMEVCSGETINLEALVSDNGMGTMTWTTDETGTSSLTPNGLKATISKNVTTRETIKITVEYENGCKADESKEIDVVFNPIPENPEVKDQAYCVDDTPRSLEATANPSTATLNWYGTNATGGTASTVVPKPTTSAAAKTEYYVSQTLAGCESERSKITVIVDANLNPTIAAAKFEICEGETLNLEAQGGIFKTTSWSGAGANELNATTLSNPVFGKTATVAGTYEVKVDVEDDKGCKGSTTKTITVHPIPSAALSELADKCLSESGTQTLTATITPAGTVGTGTWTGTVVTKSTETTATYVPSMAGVGTHDIKYDFVSDKGCEAEQVSTDVDVFAMPNPSIDVDNKDVCVSGNNSSVVNVLPTGVAATATKAVYSVDKGGVVDASTGAFDPVQNTTPGEYTITLDYADVNGCTATATTKLTVHALPDVTVDGPTEMCYNGANAVFTGTPAVVTGTTGVWSGTNGASSNELTPSSAAESTKITYTYTDAYKCVNSDEATITKVSVKAPTVGDSPVVVITDGNPSDPNPEMTSTVNGETGTTMEWFKAGAMGTLVTTGGSYAMAVTGTTDAGTYEYAVRQYKVVDSKNCYSDSTITAVMVSNCQAKPPVAADKYICVDDDEAATEISATHTAGATDYTLAWVTIDPVGLGETDMPLTDSRVLAKGTANVSTLGYTHGDLAVTSATTFESYVAEYDNINNCWSPGTKVTWHVVANPEVTIESPADICAKGDELVPVTVTPRTGILQPTEGTLEGFDWKPGDYTGDKLVVEFEYTVVSDPYKDGTTCTTTKKSNTVAHFMEVPEEQSYSWLIGDIQGIPNDLVAAETKGTGSDITWYSTATKAAELGTGLTLAPDKAALSAVTAGLETYKQSYYITQTDAFGCESAPVEVVLNLVDCPWGAPAVSDIEVCQGTTLNNLEASTTTAGPSWIWYDESGQKISGATTASFAHGVSNAEPKTTKFSVSYTAVEERSGNSCESPKAPVTVTVLPLPTIEFPIEEETSCYTTPEVMITVNASSTNGVGVGKWEIDGSTNDLAITESGIFKPQALGKNAGKETYTLKYTYTDAKSCVNSEERTISVVYLPALSTTGFYAMNTQTNAVEVIASGAEVGANIHWFDMEGSTSASSKQGEGATWSTGDDVSRNVEKNYYARQEMEGCYSEPTAAKVKIVPCPIPTVTVVDTEICNYEEVPAFVSMTGSWGERDGAKSEFRYYTGAASTTASGFAADGKWTPDNIQKTSTSLQAGKYTYYVSEFNSEPLIGLTNPEGCESAKVPVNITVKGTGVPTVTATITPAEVCELVTNPSFVATGLATIGEVYWFEEDPGQLGEAQLSAALGKGTTYLPSAGSVGTHSLWAVQYAGECQGPKVEATYKVKPIPAAPEMTAVAVCYGASNERLTATALAGAIVTWYGDAGKNAVLETGTATYLPKDEIVGEYKYYAAQKLDGCESATAEVIFTKKPLPSGPMITYQANICEYDASPVLKAEGEMVQWYDKDGTTKLGIAENDATYQMPETEKTAGSKRYYASQTVDGCEGPQASLSFVVNAKPASPMVTPARVCEGDTEIPSLGTNVGSDKWYADESCNTFLNEGYTYTPDYYEVGGTSKTYYVVRQLNGCLSDVVSVELTVISKPSMMIDEGEDVTLCIYDDVHTFEGTHFEPAMNESSLVEWTVRRGNLKTNLPDNAEHTLTPADVVTVAGDYEVYARYKYVFDDIYCYADTVRVDYSVKPRARKPVVFSSVICQGEQIKDLQALGSKNIIWGSLSGTMPPVDYGQRYKFTKGQTLKPGEYSFVIYDRNIYDEEAQLGCESERDTVTMTVAPAAETKLFGADSVCAGATESYYTQYTAESHYTWKVTGDNLNYSKDATSSSVRYVDWIKAGVDTLMVYEQTWAGCEGFDTLVVKIAAPPVAAFSWTMPGASNVIELVDSTRQDSLWITNLDGELEAEPVTYDMYWNFGHQGELESEIDTVMSYEKRNFAILEGNYLYGYNCPILTVKNSFGCKDVYTECIFVNITSSLYVPNAFSPSNPAHSVRTFQPKGYNLRTCEISVYDKWGNLLWVGNKVEDGKFMDSWDGTYDGKMMKSDVYVWKMEATFLDGQVWEGFETGNGNRTKFGGVTLVR